jgi:hypothetical protein
MARVSFGLRGMWLPLFFQLMSNVVFVSHNALAVVLSLTLQVRVASCVRWTGHQSDARRNELFLPQFT